MDGICPAAMTNKLPLISPRIRAKLETARVARLATLDAERRPHVFLSALPVTGRFSIPQLIASRSGWLRAGWRG